MRSCRGCCTSADISRILLAGFSFIKFPATSLICEVVGHWGHFALVSAHSTASNFRRSWGCPWVGLHSALWPGVAKKFTVLKVFELLKCDWYRGWLLKIVYLIMKYSEWVFFVLILFNLIYVVVDPLKFFFFFSKINITKYLVRKERLLNISHDNNDVFSIS